MKRRFIQDPLTLELLEVTDIPEQLRGVVDSALWGDRHYDGMRSPVDGSDISTRTKHREHMKRHGLTTVDDFQGEAWRRAEKVRQDRLRGIDPSRKHDIARAIEKLQQGYRPKVQRQ